MYTCMHVTNLTACPVLLYHEHPLSQPPLVSAPVVCICVRMYTYIHTYVICDHLLVQPSCCERSCRMNTHTYVYIRTYVVCQRPLLQPTLVTSLDAYLGYIYACVLQMYVCMCVCMCVCLYVVFEHIYIRMYIPTPKRVHSTGMRVYMLDTQKRISTCMYLPKVNVQLGAST